MAASSDVTDLEALTPNHFLLGRPSVNLPLCLTEESDFCHKKAFVKAPQRCGSVGSLNVLPPSMLGASGEKSERELQLNDLVWLVEADVPRGRYALASVLQLHRGDDGIARSATVRTSTGVYKRPLTKKAPVTTSVLDATKNGAGDVGNAIAKSIN